MFFCCCEGVFTFPRALACVCSFVNHQWCPKCCDAGELCNTTVASLPARGLNQFRLASGLDVSGRGAGGGGRFAHLPPRLRPIWQRYHRQFHITEEVEEEGGVDRVRKGGMGEV